MSTEDEVGGGPKRRSEPPLGAGLIPLINRLQDIFSQVRIHSRDACLHPNFVTHGQELEAAPPFWI